MTSQSALTALAIAALALLGAILAFQPLPGASAQAVATIIGALAGAIITGGKSRPPFDKGEKP